MSMPVQISLSVTIFREGKAFIAYSPALDLATSASSFKEVQRRFSEVVQIFFEEVTQKGTLDDVLPSLGWQKRPQKGWMPPVFISQETTTVHLPVAA